MSGIIEMRKLSKYLHIYLAWRQIDEITARVFMQNLLQYGILDNTLNYLMALRYGLKDYTNMN